MHVLRLLKANEKPFYEVLKKFGELWAPVKKDESYSYQKLNGEQPAVLSEMKDHVRTLLPIKKLLMSPEFNMLSFNKEKYIKTENHISKKVVLGVHPCEIHAVNIQTKFHTTDFEDPFYLERRNSVIIIGASCKPDPYCFCRETNTDTVDEGFDLFLTDLGDYYLVWVGSSKGEEIVRAADGLFDENLSNQEVQDFISWRKAHEAAFTNEIDMLGVTDLMELQYNNAPLWDYFGDKCLACGQCTMVCPTCTCFNVMDDLEVNKEVGHRRRYWDSCMFKDYSLVAGGHNFRKTRAERLKLWYTHKLKAFIGHYGSPSCVGCGRCLVTCPVDINVGTVVAKLKGEEVSK